MVETMDELIARVQQQVYRLTDLQEAMAAIVVGETSPDGSVTVEVDANAALTGLDFTDGINKLSPAEFEKVLVATARAAAARAIAEKAALIDTFNSESTR
ncbi:MULTISPECIES: YbaB/EbfC family nucleoid-associated protein [Nocardia]|uniref:YbaB/EbfC family nucleoid-associated protein n=1 Tax=Nocardia TaxID=1817 RepID=UPI001893BCB6|nr:MULTISPECIES: YbaB/EbfC family nucleoid-associated protein [Nocardia]MBF6349381.1 YbaB/EbfC family nucleoid-associated protein [Nocardia flavorosea]